MRELSKSILCLSAKLASLLSGPYLLCMQYHWLSRLRLQFSANLHQANGSYRTDLCEYLAVISTWFISAVISRFMVSCSVPVTGYKDFFFYWFFLMTVSVVYCLIVFRTVMYFLGMGFYVSAMVDDLAATLNDLNRSLQDRSIEESALANGIRFHNKMIEYGSSSIYVPVEIFIQVASIFIYVLFNLHFLITWPKV